MLLWTSSSSRLRFMILPGFDACLLLICSQWSVRSVTNKGWPFTTQHDPPAAGLNQTPSPIRLCIKVFWPNPTQPTTVLLGQNSKRHDMIERKTAPHCYCIPLQYESENYAKYSPVAANYVRWSLVSCVSLWHEKCDPTHVRESETTLHPTQYHPRWPNPCPCLSQSPLHIQQPSLRQCVRGTAWNTSRALVDNPHHAVLILIHAT